MWYNYVSLVLISTHPSKFWEDGRWSTRGVTSCPGYCFNALKPSGPYFFKISDSEGEVARMEFKLYKTRGLAGDIVIWESDTTPIA